MTQVRNQTFVPEDDARALAKAAAGNEDAIDQALLAFAGRIDPNTEGGSEFARLLQSERQRREIPMVDGQYVPASVDQVWRLANMCVQSGIMPEGVKTPAQMFILLSAGFEAGLKMGQILKGMMIVNNCPSVWGDVAIGMVQASPKYVAKEQSYDESTDTATFTLVMNRGGTPERTTHTFSLRDAQAAGLATKQTYQKYRKRMLMNRARAWALRDGAADVLVGLSIAEEMIDLVESRKDEATAPIQTSRADQVAARLTSRKQVEETAPKPEPGGDAPNEEPKPEPEAAPKAAADMSGSEFLASLGGSDDPVESAKAKIEAKRSKARE